MIQLHLELVYNIYFKKGIEFTIYLRIVFFKNKTSTLTFGKKDYYCAKTFISMLFKISIYFSFTIYLRVIKSLNETISEFTFF